jgi:LAO/AO transport system kinase
MQEVEQFFKQICSRDIQALAKGITLVEDTRSSSRPLAHKLIQLCHNQPKRAFRIAISGPPGVGKSTLMEALGMKLIAKSKSLAVLTVDPSSVIHGGSILGDKTRMPRLSTEKTAFVRPSPSGGFLGGLGRHTPEAMLLCDAAGFDFCFVETVGVGQSETGAKELVDLFITLQSAHAGDELQGIKKGILEVSDLILITKADSGHEIAAQRACEEHKRAQSFGTNVSVMSLSAQTGSGLDALVSLVEGRSLEPKKNKSNEQWYRAELKALFAEYVDSMDSPNFEADVPACIEAYEQFHRLGLKLEP